MDPVLETPPPNPAPAKRPEIKLLLNTEPAEPGTAAIIRDGKPVYLVDEQEFPLDYPVTRDALAGARQEAQFRREALAEIAKKMDLSVDIRNEDGIKALFGRLESSQVEKIELDKLRQMKEAGELDATADDKVKAMANKSRQEEFDALNRKVEEALSKSNAEKLKSEALSHQLVQTRTTQGLRAFYDTAKGFKPGTLKTFLMIASQPYGNAKWMPTGDANSSGVYALELIDQGTGVSVVGPDNVTPLTLQNWADQTLRTEHPTIFAQANGGPPGTVPGGAPQTNTSPADMSRTALQRQARQQLGVT